MKVALERDSVLILPETNEGRAWILLRLTQKSGRLIKSPSRVCQGITLLNTMELTLQILKVCTVDKRVWIVNLVHFPCFVLMGKDPVYIF